MYATKKRKRVDILQDKIAFRCVLLASYARTTESIMADTGLSKCQVEYTIHKASKMLKLNRESSLRMAFRRGTSAAAKAILEQTSPTVRHSLTEDLKKNR